MGLETVVNIADLNPANPPGSDPTSQGDDHIRNIKTALLHDLAGYTGAIWITGIDAGTVNAYTLTPANAIVANGLRMGIVFSPTITNTAASTMNISGLGAVAIKQVQGVDVAAGDLVAGVLYAAWFNGTEFRLISPTKNYMDQLAFAATLPAQAGSPTKLLRTTGTVSQWDNWRLYPTTRTANTIIGDADGGRKINYTVGNFTQTFSLASVLGSGFTVQLHNQTTSDGIEVEAPATNTQTSTSSNSIAAGTTWTIATGLSISNGDLVNVRRTSDGYNQRIIGTVASYNSGTGVIIVTPIYRIGSGTFTDWTITTRPAALGIDGLGSYVIWPGECRQFVCDGASLSTVVLCGFNLVYSTSGNWVKPPMYKEFGGIITCGGSSGQKSGNVGTASSGGAGGGAFPFLNKSAFFAAMETIVVGSGGAAQTATGVGLVGGNSSIGANLIVYANTNHRIGGAIRQNLTSGSSAAVGFEGAGQAVGSNNASVWGGAGTSTDGTACGSSTYGAPAGGSMTAAAAVTAPGTNVLGSVGGVAASTTSGAAGTGAGVGGGATQTGTQSGPGNTGEIQIWGVV